MVHDAIAVVDFGGQYAHLIATKVRRLAVRADILQPEDPIERFREYRGIILSGSPSLSSHGEDSEYTKEIYDLDVPILGFCFGHQEIAKHYGGTVVHGGREWGHADLHLTQEHPLFAGLDRTQTVWMSHFDSVTSVGPDFFELGWSTLDASGKPHHYAAIGSDVHRRYGFQFHAEVDATENGDAMIGNFARGICGCEPTWTLETYLEEQIAAIRDHVGDGSVFLLASGGVDSTVAALVLRDALGPGRVALLHVDNGLMRKGESAAVLELLRGLGLGEKLHFVDASDDFLHALEGLTDPEAKRRAIGNTFVEVFDREAVRLGLTAHLLGQGTIYPDTIESGGSKRSDTIKTHHNRVPIIEQLLAEGRVVEPLAELYKVEVRELGAKLGVPHEALWRHPFPGPGLGVRLLCSDGTSESIDALVGPVASLGAEHGLDARVLPIRSVGVKADLRCYEHPVLLVGSPSWEVLIRAGSTIAAEIEGVNRSLWWLGTEPPGEAACVPGTMTRDRLDLLREADAIVMDALRRHGVYDDVWQCPTVAVPMSIGGEGRELIILRPVLSVRAMTARPARLPEALLAEVRDAIAALPGVSGVALDLTSKPPGTIEWE
ncbi:MAG: GMP synthase (glutamine-hydrolyzing) [Myxococcota bacterium]|jgi:GMP synthase (glutamine-hydrolysing)